MHGSTILPKHIYTVVYAFVLNNMECICVV